MAKLNFIEIAYLVFLVVPQDETEEINQELCLAIIKALLFPKKTKTNQEPTNEYKSQS